MSKIFPKRLGLLAYSFKAQKLLLRLGSILSLMFFCIYCIIILIVILIRLKEFTCLDYCSVYLAAITLRLFISRRIDRIRWWTLVRYFISLGLAIVFNSPFHCQTISLNIFSRLLYNQFRLETVNDDLGLLKIVSYY